MSKQEFLAQLHKGLSGLPQDDIEERLAFYSEMIDDRMEEGFSEEEAIQAIGNINEIISQIVADIPLKKLVKEKMKPKKRMAVWEIVLLVLGSPIWLSLLLAMVAIILSIYVVLWSVIVSLWAIFASLIGCAFGGIVAGICIAVVGYSVAGISMIGMGLVSAGFAIFLFYGCKLATKGILLLTKKIALSIKKCFVKKEAV